MQDIMEQVLALVRKLLRELQSPSLKNIKSQLRNKFRLKSLLQRLGKLLVNAKNQKKFQNNWEQNISETIGRGKKSKRRTKNFISRKKDRKSVALAKKFMKI